MARGPAQADGLLKKMPAISDHRQPLRRPSCASRFTAGHGAARWNTPHGSSAEELPSACGSAEPLLQLVDLDVLCQRLLESELERVSDPHLRTWLRWAAEEATSLAWATPYPVLLFPLLFEEKAAQARCYHRRQQCVHDCSQQILSDLGWGAATPDALGPAPLRACAIRPGVTAA
jgi:hypothetical protein